jgi:transcriptional regulator with XRE-family HTH domain
LPRAEVAPSATNAIDLLMLNFADAVRARRFALGLTQRDLCASLTDLGVVVSQSYVSLLEAGQRREPSARVVLGLACVLGLSLDELALSDEMRKALSSARTQKVAGHG